MVHAIISIFHGNPWRQGKDVKTANISTRYVAAQGAWISDIGCPAGPMRQKIGGGQWPSGKARLYGGLPAGSAGSSPVCSFPGRVVPPVKVERPKLRRNIQVFAGVRQSSVLRGCRRTGRAIIRCICRVAVAATTISKAACGQRDAGPISLSFHYFPLSAMLSACRRPLAGVDQYAADLTAGA